MDFPRLNIEDRADPLATREGRPERRWSVVVYDNPYHLYGRVISRHESKAAAAWKRDHENAQLERNQPK